MTSDLDLLKLFYILIFLENFVKKIILIKKSKNIY